MHKFSLLCSVSLLFMAFTSTSCSRFKKEVTPEKVPLVSDNLALQAVQLGFEHMFNTTECLIYFRLGLIDFDDISSIAMMEYTFMKVGLHLSDEQKKKLHDAVSLERISDFYDPIYADAHPFIVQAIATKFKLDEAVILEMLPSEINSGDIIMKFQKGIANYLEEKNLVEDLKTFLVFKDSKSGEKLSGLIKIYFADFLFQFMLELCGESNILKLAHMFTDPLAQFVVDHVNMNSQEINTFASSFLGVVPIDVKPKIVFSSFSIAFSISQSLDKSDMYSYGIDGKDFARIILEKPLFCDNNSSRLLVSIPALLMKYADPSLRNELATKIDIQLIHFYLNQQLPNISFKKDHLYSKAGLLIKLVLERLHEFPVFSDLVLGLSEEDVVKSWNIYQGLESLRETSSQLQSKFDNVFDLVLSGKYPKCSQNLGDILLAYSALE